MEHMITMASEHTATWALTFATVHLAHRSLPEEHKHWIRAHLRRLCGRRNDDSAR